MTNLQLFHHERSCISAILGALTQCLFLSLQITKISKSKRYASSPLSFPLTNRIFFSFLGLLISHASAFLYSPLHYRSLQLCLIKNMRQSPRWEDSLSLSQGALEDISWCFNCSLSLPPISINLPISTLTLATDASLSGVDLSLLAPLP